MNEETKRTERPWTPGQPMRDLAMERLWDAAPELFEALQGFVDEMPICCCHESWTKRGRVDPQCVRCNFKECIAEAEAALAKALGSQP